MAGKSCVFLMYHELELPGRALCQPEPGYVRYVLPLEAFRQQMKWLKDSDWRGLNLSEALNYPSGSNVCITFDDGCETDLIAAAPVLREFGFHAIFYVSSGRLGLPGYMTPDQLRALDSEGFEIGCHSMTHAYLPDLAEHDLKREILDAKNQTEQILGHAIEHFSCPGGRYDERTLAMARQAGFVTVANSEYHANSPATNPYELNRVGVLRHDSFDDFIASCHGRGLWKKQLPHQARRSVQRMIGNGAYDRLRATLLGNSHS
jgi:peptidoglycan/xylan/chitin deacetylase (PgdA/CDA1 family)